MVDQIQGKRWKTFELSEYLDCSVLGVGKHNRVLVLLSWIINHMCRRMCNWDGNSLFLCNRWLGGELNSLSSGPNYMSSTRSLLNKCNLENIVKKEVRYVVLSMLLRFKVDRKDGDRYIALKVQDSKVWVWPWSIASIGWIVQVYIYWYQPEQIGLMPLILSSPRYRFMNTQECLLNLKKAQPSNLYTSSYLTTLTIPNRNIHVLLEIFTVRRWKPR